MESANDLLPMGEALAQNYAEIVYREAQQQYAFLLNMQEEAQKRTACRTRTCSDTGGTIHLSKYYRRYFNDATSELDEWQKHMLLTICFAYKTRANVLQFLEDLDGSSFGWVPLFVNLVRHYGVDSAFVETVPTLHTSYLEGKATGAAGMEPPVEFRLRYQTRKGMQSLAPSPNHSLLLEDPKSGPARSQSAATQPLEVPTATTSQLRPRPYFVLSTLPLAFPSKFFQALVTHAPIQHLTTTNILAYPGAFQLSLSEALQSFLGNNLPNFWMRDLPPDSTDRHPTVVAWMAFFDHLSADRERLQLVSGQQLQHDLYATGQDGEYGMTDINMWLASWRAERQRDVGTREGSQETLLNVGLSVANDAQAGDEDHMSVDEDEDGGRVLSADRVRKRVTWSENLERVKEIPRRGRKSKLLPTSKI